MLDRSIASSRQPTDHTDKHRFHRGHHNIADCPQMTQMDADSVAAIAHRRVESQRTPRPTISKGTKASHWALRCLASPRPGLLVRLRRPSVADQRGRAEVIGRTATTQISRAAASLQLEQMHRNVQPRGLPGSAIVWIVPRSRKVVPAQWRARHAPVSGVSRAHSLRNRRMEETPGHGTNFVEELDRLVRSLAIDGSRLNQELKMAVNFLGRREGDTPVVEPVSA